MNHEERISEIKMKRPTSKDRSKEIADLILEYLYDDKNLARDIWKEIIDFDLEKDIKYSQHTIARVFLLISEKESIGACWLAFNIKGLIKNMIINGYASSENGQAIVYNLVNCSLKYNRIDCAVSVMKQAVKKDVMEDTPDNLNHRYRYTNNICALLLGVGEPLKRDYLLPNNNMNKILEFLEQCMTIDNEIAQAVFFTYKILIGGEPCTNVELVKEYLQLLCQPLEGEPIVKLMYLEKDYIAQEFMNDLIIEHLEKGLNYMSSEQIEYRWFLTQAAEYSEIRDCIMRNYDDLYYFCNTILNYYVNKNRWNEFTDFYKKYMEAEQHRGKKGHVSLIKAYFKDLSYGDLKDENNHEWDNVKLPTPGELIEQGPKTLEQLEKEALEENDEKREYETVAQWTVQKKEKFIGALKEIIKFVDREKEPELFEMIAGYIA